MYVVALARERAQASAHKQSLPMPLSAREPGFDLEVGYANKAL